MVCLLTIGPTRHSLVFVLPTHRGMARLSWAEFHAGVVYSHIPVPARPEVQHCDQYRHAISCCREDVAFVNNIENLKKNLHNVVGWRCSLMCISNRRHGQDNTVLSCLARVCGVKWTQNKSRLSATENCETEQVQLFAVLSCLEMRCELSFVLSWPSFQVATRNCPSPVAVTAASLSVDQMCGTACHTTSQEQTENISVWRWYALAHLLHLRRIWAI